MKERGYKDDIHEIHEVHFQRSWPPRFYFSPPLLHSLIIFGIVQVIPLISDSLLPNFVFAVKHFRLIKNHSILATMNKQFKFIIKIYILAYIIF